MLRIMAELLSICIPTYNRAVYLRDLLDGLIRELEQTPEASDQVRLYISDNASTDATKEVIDALSPHWPVIYNRNPVNIGGDRNFAQMISRVAGTYFWLLGDDELIVPGFLGPLLNVLKSGTPHLVLLETINEKNEPYYPLKTTAPDTFPDYAAFLEHYRKEDPWRMMLHSVISMMVIKHAIYDQEMSQRILKTVDRNYTHMYSVTEGLIRHPGCIYRQRVPSIRIRSQRALTDTSHLQMAYQWSRYFRWLGKKLGHPDLILFGRQLFPWKQRRRWLRERFKTAFGFGPKLTR